MYLSDYIALDNPDIDCLRDFDHDDDTLNYVVPRASPQRYLLTSVEPRSCFSQLFICMA